MATFQTMKERGVLCMLTLNSGIINSSLFANRYIPDYISGDFDSINPDVMNFYRAKVRDV